MLEKRSGVFFIAGLFFFGLAFVGVEHVYSLGM